MKRNTFTAGLRRSKLFGMSPNLVLGVFVGIVFFFLASACVYASGHEGGGINPLSWKTDLAIWTAVVFLCLVLILGKFAFGPISKALDQRELSMEDQLERVKKANADAQELLSQYQQKLSESEEEVRKILSSARDDAAKTAQAIVDQAKEAAEGERKRAVQDIQSATDGALEELACRSADLATSLAGKILKEQIDPGRHAQLIHGALSNFSGKQSDN
ncbi:MAG: F0F1 ATP synthase subunit B [Thermoguttaceae bacterium]|nr:F0F1 ATP synthase subunit B [Thermoguttaceae bacterium]